MFLIPVNAPISSKPSANFHRQVSHSILCIEPVRHIEKSFLNSQGSFWGGGLRKCTAEAFSIQLRSIL